MSRKLGSPPSPTSRKANAGRTQAGQSGCKSRCADSALKHRPRESCPKAAGSAKLAEKSEERELTRSIPMSEEAMGKAHRLKGHIVETSKQLNSEAGSISGGLRPERTCSTVGVGGGDKPATVTPGTGERIHPTASNAAQPERGKLLPVFPGQSARTPAEGSPYDPRSVGQTHKTTQRSGEGFAPKQTPEATLRTRRQGDESTKQHGETCPKPQNRKEGKRKPQPSPWQDVSWQEVEQRIYRRMCQIYVAAKARDFSRVRTLQSQLVRSFAARLWAVHQVCVINKGKDAAGVDGVCRLSDSAKWTLAINLDLGKPHAPMLRRWIPKAGKKEMRPLALPTIEDRCRAKLVVLVLEPEVEARLHRDVYGFRRGRSQADAMASIRNFTNKCPQGKFVLDADIQDFFGSVSRDFLMRSLKLPRPLLRFIRSMLHAPTEDGGRLVHTPGIPQGSPLSPVLANLVLSGLHEHVEQHFQNLRKNHPPAAQWKTPTIIIYADDLVVLSHRLETLQHARDAIVGFLRPRGLSLHPDKTCIRHTLAGNTVPAGFDFLGFTVRSFPVGKYKKASGSSGMQTLIRPSPKSLKTHHAKLALTLRYHRNKPISNRIAALNRIIRGWCNYVATENSAEALSSEDHILYGMLWHFIKRRHQKKTSATKLYALYWPQIDGRKTFSDPANRNITLLSHAARKIEAHIKVRGDASYFNGDLTYWTSRRKREHVLTRARRVLRESAQSKQTKLTVTDALAAEDDDELWLQGMPIEMLTDSKSRMRGNSHVRFGRRGCSGDGTLDSNNHQRTDECPL